MNDPFHPTREFSITDVEFFNFIFYFCRIDNMMVVAGDYSISIYEGTEQEIFPQFLIPHPDHNSTTYNNDIMLIKV